MSESVTPIVGLVFFVGVIALLALGVAFMLHVFKRQMSQARRALISGIVASGAPSLLPLVAIAMQGFEFEMVIVIVAMLVMALIGVAVIGFPVAYFATRRWERRDEGHK